MTSVGPLPRFHRIQQQTLPTPMGVGLVAGFQLFKAAVLLAVALLLRFSPQAVTSTEGVVYPLFFIAMRGNTPAMQAAMQGGSFLPVILGCLGLYVGYVGLGLLSMRTWARRSVLFTYGATVALYCKSVLMPGAAEAMALRSQSTHALHFNALLILDALVFVYFLRGATADSFRPRSGAFSRVSFQYFY